MSEVVFELDGVTIIDNGGDIHISDGPNMVHICRRTFMQIIGGDLWERLGENAPSSAAPAEIIAASRAIEEAEHGVTPTEKAGEAER